MEDLEKYLEQRRKMARYILVICYVTFICYVLAEFVILPNSVFEYKSWLYIPYEITLRVLPFWVIAWCYFAIRSISMQTIILRLQNNTFLKAYLTKMISFVSLFTIAIIMISHLNSYTTTGCFTVEDKFERRNVHYLVINNINVKCDQQTFDHVIEGIGYSLTYKWFIYTPNNGSLEKLDI